MGDWLKRFLYAVTFQVATYALVSWVTDSPVLAIAAAVVSHLIAASDWDWRQRRKAEKDGKPEVSDAS